MLYCYFPWTPATRAFEVGSSFLWYEGCREHRGCGSSKLWNIRNQVMESESSRFKISTYFNKFNWTVPYTLKQKAEPSFKSHPVESSESFISEPSVVFQGLTFTFSIKKSVAHERSFTCFLQILSPDFRTAGFRHPLQCSASASSLGLRLLLIRALLYWLPLPVASSEGSKKDAHTQSAEELVTLLSESRVNHWRRSTSQYNLMTTIPSEHLPSFSHA